MAIGVLLLVLASVLVAGGLQLLGRRASEKRLNESVLEPLVRAAITKARQDVEKFGWHVVLVPGEEGDSGFLYTVGLWKTYRHPEIILFSTSENPGVFLGRLAAIAKRIAAGERFEPGKTYEGLFGKYPGAFRTVQADRYESYVGIAGWVYGSFDFPEEQLFWPDHGGRFPWMSGFDEEVRHRQPQLYEPKPGKLGSRRRDERLSR